MRDNLGTVYNTQMLRIDPTPEIIQAKEIKRNRRNRTMVLHVCPIAILVNVLLQPRVDVSDVVVQRGRFEGVRFAYLDGFHTVAAQIVQETGIIEENVFGVGNGFVVVGQPDVGTGFFGVGFREGGRVNAESVS